MTYLITFSTYGSHLHGDDRGSVDRDHNLPGSTAVEPSAELSKFEQRAMEQSPYLLDDRRRSIVAQAIRVLCADRKIYLVALHVRSNHVHAIVDVDCKPEAIAVDLKRYASRALNQSSLDYSGRKRWTRGFSARVLPNREAIDRVIQYVAVNQGNPMALFVAG